MSYKPTEVLVGALVLVAAVGFVLFAGQKTGLASRGSDSYPLHASFRSLDGVSVGTEVRLAGVRVGSVTDMRLNPETYRADATLSLRKSVRIPDDSAAAVASEGLLGGNFVELSPGASFDYLEPGGEIVDTQGSVSLISLLLKFVSASGGDDR